VCIFLFSFFIYSGNAYDMLIFIFVYNVCGMYDFFLTQSYPLRLLRRCHRTCSTVNPSCCCPSEAPRTAAPPRRPVAWLGLTACPAPWRRSASPLLPSLDGCVEPQLFAAAKCCAPLPYVEPSTGDVPGRHARTAVPRGRVVVLLMRGMGLLRPQRLCSLVACCFCATTTC
jgi:hypothetical protein